MEAVLAALAAGETVVTANKRLARSIDLAWQRRQLAAGVPAWRTPRILPWGAWVEQLWLDSVVNGGHAGQRSLISDLQARLVWRDIVCDADELLLPGAASALAEVAWRAWRLTADWHVNLETLAAAADSDDSRRFAGWAGVFRQTCASEGWADAGEMLPLLAADLQLGHLHPAAGIRLVGFGPWTPMQQEFLRVLAASGCSVEEEPPPRVAGTVVRRIACKELGEELGTAARWARGQLEEDPHRTIGVVVPDLSARSGEVRRAFLDILNPEWRLRPGPEEPVNFSFAGSLAETALFRAAVIAMRVLAGALDYREAGYLLRSPYVRGGQAEAAARADIDRHIRDRMGMVVDLDALVGRAGDRAPIFCQSLRAIGLIAADLPRRQSAADWAGSFRRVLDAAGWPGDRSLGTDEYQTAMACQTLWDDLRGCSRFVGELALDGALQLMEHLARDAAFQPAGRPEAVQVLGTLEALGQSFDALWICGLTSDAWPPAPRPNPLLPLGLQRQLQMPDSTPAVARLTAERVLRWLQSSAHTVVASWPEFSGEEPLAASPLIAHLPPCTVEELGLSSARRQAPLLAQAHCAGPVGADPPPPVVSPSRLRGGARLLELEARCPARAFLEFRLGARELPAPCIGIDSATRGMIVHEVLHEFFSRIRSHRELRQLTPADEQEILEPLIAKAISKNVPHQTPVLARIVRNEQARLRRLVGRFLEAERLRPGFEILWTEAMRQPARAPEGSRCPPAVAALGVELRADRVDLLPDGGTLVIDYKTGRSLPGRKELWGSRPRSPQLPLYATLADADGVAFVHLASGPVEWLGVGRDSWNIAGIQDAGDFTKNDVSDWGALRAAWWTALERLAHEILAGCFDIDRWRRDEAIGQWAMATRVYELDDEEAEDGRP